MIVTKNEDVYVDSESTPNLGVQFTPLERLEYIAQIVEELQKLASQTGCYTLAEILDVACLEAELQRKLCGEI